MDLTTILSLCGFPSLFTMFLGYLLARVKQQRKETEALKDGVKSLLRDRILMSYHYCSNQGKRNELDTQNFLDMVESYEGLNGNSFVADVKKSFLELDLEV